MAGTSGDEFAERGRFGCADGSGKAGASTSARVLRELLALPSNSACVDAMTPELRQRIAAASRLRIASLLPNLR